MMDATVGNKGMVMASEKGGGRGVGGGGGGGGKWVCPNDRQLALRAKLKTGWSVKTQDLHEYGRKTESLNETEQSLIVKVIQRAEVLEQRERERVGKLVDRLDNMKRNVMGNGTTHCILCGDAFRMFGTSHFVCCGCKKLVCEKCGIEIVSSGREPLWLCKICSETREMWKKSGAWFFRGLPKYTLPEKKTEKYGIRKITTRPTTEKNVWSKTNVDLSETLSKIDLFDDTDSSPCQSDPRQSSDKTTNVAEEMEKCSTRIFANKTQIRDFENFQGSFANPVAIVDDENEHEKSLESVSDKVFKKETPFKISNKDFSLFGKPKSFIISGLGSKSKSGLGSRSINVVPTTASSSLAHRNHYALSIADKNNFDVAISPTSETKSFEFSEKFVKIVGSSSNFNSQNLSPRTGKKTLDAPTKSVTDSLRSNSPIVEQTFAPADSRLNRKKVAIHFEKASTFFKHPLKHPLDKKKDKGKMNSLSWYESGEGRVDSTWEEDVVKPQILEKFDSCGGSSSETDSLRGDARSVVSPSDHWILRDCPKGRTMDYTSDINLPNVSRQESPTTSVSRDDESEDRTSLFDSAGINQEEEDVALTIGSENDRLGVLEISLWYDPIRSTLHCTLHRGKGLTSTDINGLADPFCKLNVLPATRNSMVLKTKTVHKTINPEFNENVNFYGITETDVQRKTLHILVLDDDRYGNDFLGEARIPLFRVGAKQTKHISVFLEKHHCRTEDDNETWGEDGWNRGKIFVTLCYSTKKRALIVIVGRCTNLLPMDNNSLSDPFIKLHLNPDPNHKRCKTSIKWKNLNPVFNEEFVFETKMTDLSKQTLVLTVWDKDYGKSNDYLGGLELGWKSKGERLKHWIDVIKFPDHKHEGWHRLGDNYIAD